MKRRLIVIASLVSIHCWSPAHAWGDDGHRITGHIANELLTDSARRELRALIGTDDLSQVATWLDDQREALEQRYSGSSRWHYENREVCDASITRDAACPRGSCVTRQIDRFAAILKDKTNSREKRAEAVRVLVHLIGDLHQPLHLADNNDRGGNDAYVLLPREREPRRLHEVWDTGLVRLNMNHRNDANYARFLSNEFDTRKKNWQRGDVARWAQETYALGKQAYEELPQFACGKRESATIKLPAAYLQHARATVELQLAKAGERIAYLLNESLSP